MCTESIGKIFIDFRQNFYKMNWEPWRKEQQGLRDQKGMTEERDSMLYAVIVSLVEEVDILAYRWNQEDVIGVLGSGG